MDILYRAKAAYTMLYPSMLTSSVSSIMLVTIENYDSLVLHCSLGEARVANTTTASE